MARKIFALGIFAMASAFGAIGYQVLTYYFYGDWPVVSFRFVFERVFGDFPVLAWHWADELLIATGKLPAAVVAIIVCYILLLLSDLLRGEGRRQSSS